jgi:hypothetical protein
VHQPGALEVTADRRLRPGRHRCRVPGRRAAAPGSGGVRGLVAGPAGPDRSPARAALPVSMEHTLVTEGRLPRKTEG